MAYAVNWITKVITIPTSDLTLISGTRYSLPMADCLTEIRRLEWEPTEGLWAPAILDHTDTRVDFAGANYAPFDDFINGYTVQFSGVATRVDLLGSNNDLIDILIPTGVSVVPSNSAGLQVVTSGSGVTQQDKDDIENQIFARVVEGAFTFEQITRVIAAFAAGDVVQQSNGDYVIKGIDGVTDRVSGEPGANNGRDVISVDGA